MFQTVWLEAIYWFCQNHMKSNTGLAESMQVEVAQSCPIPCNPMDHDSPWNSPGQNTGEDLSFSRGSSQPRDQTQFSPAEPQGKPKNIGVGSLSLLQQIFPTQELNQGLLHAGGFFTNWAIREAELSLTLILLEEECVCTTTRWGLMGTLIISTKSWGFQLFFDESGLQDSCRIRLSHHSFLALINQTVCNNMTQEQWNYATKKFFSDTIKLLEQTFHTYEKTVWNYYFI